MKTTVVNLFAGPGVGKSTNAALTFGKLKTQGITAELVSEYAKDLVWEERHHALSFQPYLSAKQSYRIQRVLGKVPVVITDSPILLSLVYDDAMNDTSFEDFLIDTFESWNTLNFHLIRNDEAHPFVSTGRTQKDVSEAMEIDNKISDLLVKYMIPHKIITVGEGETTADHMVSVIKEHIGEQDA